MSINNPIIDTRVYEVDYADGYRHTLAANMIADNIFSQVNKQGRLHRLLDLVIYVRANGQEVNKKKHSLYFIMNKTRKYTNRGWKLCTQWKYGKIYWSTLKCANCFYPVKLAEFAV